MEYIEITGFILILIGSALLYMGFKPSRISIIVFGHLCVFTGCILATWGFFSIFGGICAIYHGFCRCVRYHGKE
jgi:hypothetical protein